MHRECDLIELRKSAIREITSSDNKQQFIENNAETLFSLDLTMYSQDKTLNSLFYNAVALSKLDNDISLHPDQYKALRLLKKNNGLILSAPTSFGKTYVIFEYIAREFPKTVFLVVPTLALIDEYKRKIITKYRDVFGRYKIFTSLRNEISYDEFPYKMFIVTHDRVLEEASFDNIENIDLLVIDEVYKLDRRGSDDRKLVLNFAYYYLVKKSNKHVLLAPFISDIENINSLEKHPILFASKFSPVVNDVIECPIYIDTIEERFKEANRIIETIAPEKRTLTYFANASDIPKYVKLYSNKNFDESLISETTIRFLEWMRDEIHPNWYVVEAMEKGFLVHCGDLQLGIRNMELDIFENDSEPYNVMLCTSTLLEGVNTSTENIIITKPCRSYGYNFSNDFEAFDFFNLVGRSGRLFKANLGKAYYIKSPTDKTYVLQDAIKSIEFEITSESIDVKIQKNECDDQEYIDFLKKLHCSKEEYLSVVGYSRFSKVKELYDAYCYFKEELRCALDAIIESPVSHSRATVIYKLLQIFNCRLNRNFNGYLNYKAVIINYVINMQRYSTKRIIEFTLENMGTFNRTLDQVISDVLKTKNAYIEYDFTKYLNIILFFMKQDGMNHSYTNYIVENVLNNINYLYYKNEPIKRILKESGIYDRDIDVVYEYVKNCGEDINQIRESLKNSITSFKNNVSFITLYSVSRM